MLSLIDRLGVEELSASRKASALARNKYYTWSRFVVYDTRRNLVNKGHNASRCNPYLQKHALGMKTLALLEAAIFSLACFF